MEIGDYRPQSKLVTKETAVPTPRFPVIDAHNHLADPFGGGWDKRPLAELLDRLDAAHVDVYVDLDGGWGEDILQRHLDHFKQLMSRRIPHIGIVLEYNKFACCHLSPCR